MNILDDKYVELLAFRYSELAYNEACKPKAEQNQYAIDRWLNSAKVMTNWLIDKGIWQERN